MAVFKIFLQRKTLTGNVLHTCRQKKRYLDRIETLKWEIGEINTKDVKNVPASRRSVVHLCAKVAAFSKIGKDEGHPKDQKWITMILIGPAFAKPHAQSGLTRCVLTLVLHFSNFF